jgi:hypothetical protein
VALPLSSSESTMSILRPSLDISIRYFRYFVPNLGRAQCALWQTPERGLF